MSVSVFDFEKDRAFLKTKGYTLIDYTKKIKKINDIKVIQDKVKTTNNGEFVYTKLVIIIRWEEVCKRIRGLKEALMNFNDNPDGIQVFYKDFNMCFHKNYAPNAIVWERYLNAGDIMTCEICCEDNTHRDMMACPCCIFPCCRKCFMKRYDLSNDPRCFGCRHPLVMEYDEKK
jgi:hypothetical protein